jgi:hypothetical protein
MCTLIRRFVTYTEVKTVDAIDIRVTEGGPEEQNKNHCSLITF